MAYLTTSPVLFIIFNRPDTTIRVFEKIKEAKPSKLYVAADGPRKERGNENKLCEEARACIAQIDWACEVKTLFSDINQGCKYAVSSALTWFFENEEEGIILEDDCLPSNDFFRFCDEMLHRYKFDTRIRHITGCNLQFGKIWGNASYYFSNNTHVWGWASWRRVWADYDVELEKYIPHEVAEQFSKIFHEPILVDSWTNIFRELKDGKIDTWDYQLGITNFFNNGLCIIPNVNLISNIGFRPDGTHTIKHDDPNSDIPLQTLSQFITHPKYIIPEKKADFFTLNRDFDLEKKEKKRQKERIKRWFKMKFLINKIKGK